MQQLENELAQTQGNLEQATHNLEEKEKALQNVRVPQKTGECSYFANLFLKFKLFFGRIFLS